MAIDLNTEIADLLRSTGKNGDQKWHTAIKFLLRYMCEKSGKCYKENLYRTSREYMWINDIYIAEQDTNNKDKKLFHSMMRIINAQEYPPLSEIILYIRKNLAKRYIPIRIKKAKEEPPQLITDAEIYIMETDLCNEMGLACPAEPGGGVEKKDKVEDKRHTPNKNKSIIDLWEGKHTIFDDDELDESAKLGGKGHEKKKRRKKKKKETIQCLRMVGLPNLGYQYHQL